MAYDLSKGDEANAGVYFLGERPALVSCMTNRLLGYRRTEWSVRTRDGGFGRFVSTWWFGHLQVYAGDAKIDGTRTLMYRDGQLASDADGYVPDPALWVYTDKPAELNAFRWRAAGPGVLDAMNMGGC